MAAVFNQHRHGREEAPAEAARFAMGQGPHPDPLDPNCPVPDQAHWPARQKAAFASPAMRHFREAIQLPGIAGLRASVIDDLTTFYGIDEDQCVRCCIEWEQWSVDEWSQRSRSTVEGLTEFYHHLQSWSFDLSWYAYLQAEGYAYPANVAIAMDVGQRPAGSRHLDFGSGVGVTSQLFARLGFESEMADISTSLLQFAKHRLDRRGESLRQIDLNTEPIGVGKYDVITAVDTLTQVPNLDEVARTLHASLRPGGLLYTNFDVRPPAPENAWHLYSDDLPLRWKLHRAGFEEEGRLDGMVIRYRRVAGRGLAHELRGARDLVLVKSPLRRLYRETRRLQLSAQRRRSE